jgi:hypothetical protein
MKNNLLKLIMFLMVCFGLTAWMSAQTVIPVAAGDYAINTALLDAFAGDIIELTTSGGTYMDTTIHVTFNITIRAAAGLDEKPVLDAGDTDPVFEVETGGLTLDGIKIMGGGYVIHASPPAEVESDDFSIKVNNCEFHNWTQRAIYTSDGSETPIDSVLVSNSIFMDGVKQAFYLKTTRTGSGIFPGSYRYCKIENCLITGLTSTGDGHATYIEPGHREVSDQGWPTVIIDHVTVYDCSFGISTYTTPGALVTNCIVTNLKNPANKCYDLQSGRWTTEPLPPPSEIKNSIYCNGRLDLVGSSTVTSVAENVDSVEVTYVDAVHGNFALADGSPGKAAGTDGKDLGYLGPYLFLPTLPVIKCPGFEEDTSFVAWTQDWDNSSINEDAAYVFSGSRSLKIGPQGGRAQYVEGYTIGTTISLLAWAKSDAELVEHAYCGVEIKDEFGIMLLEADSRVNGVTTINPDGWTRLCAVMTVPEGTAEFMVYFWSSAEVESGGQSVYSDDYEFKFGDSCTVTNVKEIKYNSSVNVFPNPTDGPVQLTVGRDISGISSIEIYDVTGKVVSRLNNLNGQDNIRMDLSSFAEGVYFGRMQAQTGTYSFKIIRK